MSVTDGSLHVPAMVREVVSKLQPRPHGKYVDATLGMGGHAAALLETTEDIFLLGIDRDRQALSESAHRLHAWGNRVTYIHDTFGNVERTVQRAGWNAVDGILADIGVSSVHLDVADRGFSFMHEGPLDMRMDQTQGEPASAWLERASEEEMTKVFFEYGEERYASRIARAIVHQRKKQPIQTTQELARIVLAAVPKKFHTKIHPATRVFQAVRIFINRELEELDQFLAKAPQLLTPGGRLVVISYHSLEDRRVKWAFRSLAREHYRILTKRPERPSDAECRTNRRVRSAKLRAIERIAA